mmetsp:Transcript_16881/g.12064  ORF Transcript_16881/g.12064 Transcript_16881/m.12064 type:complete len:122 (+) Transcript_16881:97-462(+)
MIASISATISFFCLLFSDSILSLRLEEMGVKDNNIGFVFGGTCFTYAMCCPIVGILNTKVKGTYLTFIGLVISVVALIFYGPSQLLHLPDSLGLLIFGFLLLAVAISFIYIPTMPTIITAL